MNHPIANDDSGNGAVPELRYGPFNKLEINEGYALYLHRPDSGPVQQQKINGYIEMNSVYDKLNILLVSGVAEHVSDFEQVLDSAGHALSTRVIDGNRILLWYQQSRPDILILDVETVNEDMFASLQQIISQNPCPIIVFTHDDNRVSIGRAISAGISAYVVKGYSPKRIVPLIDTAIHRFNQAITVQMELTTTRHKLEERKVIEKAKGIVMRKSAVDEAIAYKTLRDMAMNQNMKLVEVARSIVTASEIMV